MNQLQHTLSHYLSETGESMRSLSLRAGLHEKSVSRILTVDGHRPRRAALDALSRAMQRDLPCDTVGEKVTFAGLIARIPQKVNDPARAQRLVQRLRWLVRSAGWVAEFETVDRSKVIAFFAERNAASFGISKRSYSTYKAEIMTAFDVALPRARGRMINDLDGIYAEVHGVLKDSTLPTDMKLASGAFLVFLNDQVIAPEAITTATLEQYFLHRLEVSPKGQAVAQKHVSRIVALMRELATRPEFVRFGFVAAGSPFSDGRDKYGVGNDVITAIMSEFDSRIAPWAMGRVSRDGKSIDEFIAWLDAQKPARDDKKRALLRRSGIKAPASETGTAREVALSAQGFLLPKARWSAATLSGRRGYIVAGVKALYARTGYFGIIAGSPFPPGVEFVVTEYLGCKSVATTKTASQIVGASNIFALGRTRYEDAKQRAFIGAEAALQARDGVLLMLAATLGFRAEALAALSFGTTLVLGPRPQIMVDIPGTAMKMRQRAKARTRLRDEFSNPDLWDVLQEYRIHFRPILDGGAAVFPSKLALGQALSSERLSNIMGALTEAHFGVRITLHRVRDNIATEAVEEMAEGVSVAAGVLRHKDRRTTEKHYIRQQGRVAMQQLAHLTDGVRGKRTRLKL